MKWGGAELSEKKGIRIIRQVVSMGQSRRQVVIEVRVRARRSQLMVDPEGHAGRA